MGRRERSCVRDRAEAMQVDTQTGHTDPVSQHCHRPCRAEAPIICINKVFLAA